MELTDLIAALAHPAAFPDGTAAEVRQTHISAVFLSGPFAYKVKKPVTLPFLDFGTLQKRLHFCREEVRLNRRLAPDVYLGVVPVVLTSRGPRFEVEGEPIEWAVKMRRLPDEATLLERLRRKELPAGLVETLARRIAAFHRTAESNARVAEAGRFQQVARTVRNVFTQSAGQAGTTIGHDVLRRTAALAEEALTAHRRVIEERAARGVPRDCHGDLRLDHVYYFPDRDPPGDLVAIDCIEFNDALRFIDPVADVAFAVMDLAFQGRRDLSGVLADAYFRESGDEEGRALLPLYVAYRAAVRGEVRGLMCREPEVPEEKRKAALRSSRAHWLLSLSELEAPGRRPCLVLVAGLPGSGKSTLARGLAERAGFTVIRSDVVRKELAGHPADSPLPDSTYTAEWNGRTYAECLRRAEAELFEGRRVVVDATFWEERPRAAFLNLAAEWGVPAAMLHCRVSPETARRRLERRQGDASDAGWSVHQVLAGRWQPSADAGRFLHTLPADGTPAAVLNAALDVLRQLGVQD